MNLALAEVDLPVRIRSDRPMTDEEFARFCAENEPFKVEREANGELIVMSPSFTEGGGRESRAGGYLFMWTLADGRGEYYGSSTGFTLPDTSVRSADGAWVSRDRLNALTAEERKGFYRICPDFVIEVRSETDRLAAAREKMERWIANGAALAWLIDPERRVVEVYRPGEPVDVYEDPASVQGTGPVRGFELVMARVWA